MVFAYKAQKQGFDFIPSEYQIWIDGDMVRSGNTNMPITVRNILIDNNEKTEVTFCDSALQTELCSKNIFDEYIALGDRLQLLMLPEITTGAFRNFGSNEPYSCIVSTLNGIISEFKFSFGNPNLYKEHGKIIRFFKYVPDKSSAKAILSESISNFMKVRAGNQETIAKDFLFQGKIITIRNIVYELDSSKIYTNKYSYAEIQGQKRELLSITEKQEFYNDIELQLNLLQNKKLIHRDFVDALIEACSRHIEKFKRLIITDLDAYLNCTMYLVDATNNAFHNLIKNEEEGIKLRNFYESLCIEILSEYIWVPDPFGAMENGMAKIIPYKEAQFYSENRSKATTDIVEPTQQENPVTKTEEKPKKETALEKANREVNEAIKADKERKAQEVLKANKKEDSVIDKLTNPLNVVITSEGFGTKYNFPNFRELFENDVKINYGILRTQYSGVSQEKMIELITYYTIDNLIEFRDTAHYIDNKLPIVVIEEVKKQIYEIAKKNWEIFDEDFVKQRLFAEIDNKIWKQNIVAETRTYMRQFERR